MNRGIKGFADKQLSEVTTTYAEIGSQAIVNSNQSLSVGINCTASNCYSTVIGYNNTSSAFITPGTKSGNYGPSFGSLLIGAWNFATSSSYASVSIGFINNQAGATLSGVNGNIKGIPKCAATIGRLSTAVGINNTTSGLYSTALGDSNSAGSTGSTAIGYQSSAGGSGATAVGFQCTANGPVSTALGYQSTTQLANQATAVGFQNVVTSSGGTQGLYNSAVGYKNTAGGRYSTAMGMQNSTGAGVSNAAVGCNNSASNGGVALGYSNGANSGSAVGQGNSASVSPSNAFGYQNTASGYWCSAFGYKCNVSGNSSSAFGYSNTVSVGGSVAVGTNITNTVASSAEFGADNTNKLHLDANIITFQGRGIPFLLSTTTGISATTVTTTPLYTVPTGRTAVITQAVVRCTAITAFTVAGAVSVGVTATNYNDIFATTPLTGLSTTSVAYTMNNSNVVFGLGASTNVVKLNVSTGATATAMTVAVDLIGYLV